MAKKDRRKLEAIKNKVSQIVENPHHFKPLRGDMHGARRAHIDGSFILTYDIDEGRGRVRLLDFEHHDKAY